LKQLHRECGYDAEAIADAIRAMMHQTLSVQFG